MGTNYLLEALKKKKFIVSTQIDPPGIGPVSEFKKVLRKLMKAGVKIVDINSSRRISHDSVHLAGELSRLGFEVIPHVTVRDSLISGLINQILAAYHWGSVKNFLIITGDPYETKQAILNTKGIFQTDSIGALKFLDEYLRKDPRFRLKINLSAAVNQNEENLIKEGERVKCKKDAGADFFMSQPVFDKIQARKLFDFYFKYSNKPLIVGIWPLMHSKTFEVIKTGKVVGVKVPQRIINETKNFISDEESLRIWSIKKSAQLINFIKDTKIAAGVYIVAPLKNPLLLLDILERIKNPRVKA